MRLSSGLVCALLAALTASKVWAGGSGLNIAVVVNQNSTNSIQLANAYCEQRGVPPQNVLRLTHQWSGGSESCTTDEFQNNLLTPLLSMLQTGNLTNQIQFVLLSMNIPYRVIGTNGVNSTTSALFYGFKPDTPPPGPGLPASCSLPDNSSNSYAFSELSFADAPPGTAVTNSFLAVMLTDTNLASALNTLNRGVASDSTFPTQNVYLAKTGDPDRNVRFYEFDNAVFDAQISGDYSVSRVLSSSTDYTNLSGFETGLTNFTLATNAFVPGAIGDNLTSFGGYLFEPSGQAPATAFLEAGAVVSYGTVVEPCGYLQKFPNPLDYFYQTRGFSVAESYYQSVQNPYQGIMVGEPLSAPFARRGTGIWEGLPSGTAVLSGHANLQVAFSSAATNLPLNRVDLFIDGTWFETITNVPPTPGDLLSVTLNGVPNTYTVPANATIASVTAGLASVLNSASNSTLVRATALGDRIALRSLDPALPGASVSVEASVTNNTTTPTTLLTSALPSFLDTIAYGYHNILVSNAPAVGDWLQLRIVETNGNVLNYGVTNTVNGETIGQLLNALFYALYGSPPLTTPAGLGPNDFDDESQFGFADMNLDAISPGWPASAIRVTFTASPDLVVQAPATNLLQDNLSDLQPRNHLYVAAGKLSPPVNWTLDTTQLADGYHELTAVAYEGTSVRTQTTVNQSVRVQNTALSATLNTLYGGSNTDLGATLQFSVVVNTNNVSTIAFFGTGGLLGTVTNQSAAYFSVAGTNLGIGLHPFYAIVTTTVGNQYRTATTWIRLIGPEPPLTLSVDNSPLTLQWSATAGRTYNVLMATNLAGPFTNTATVTPSNTAGVWVDTNNLSTATFYLIKTSD